MSMKGLRKSALEDSSPMRLVLTVAVSSTENRKKKTIPWVVILEAQSQAYRGRMNEIVKFFEIFPFLGVGFDFLCAC